MKDKLQSSQWKRDEIYGKSQETQSHLCEQRFIRCRILSNLGKFSDSSDEFIKCLFALCLSWLHEKSTLDSERPIHGRRMKSCSTEKSKIQRKESRDTKIRRERKGGREKIDALEKGRRDIERKTLIRRTNKKMQRNRSVQKNSEREKEKRGRERPSSIKDFAKSKVVNLVPLRKESLKRHSCIHRLLSNAGVRTSFNEFNK